MIQRIQSIFLFLAALANGGQFILPYATTSEQGVLAAAAPALADGVFNPFDNMGLMGLSILATLVAFAAIFSYKNRMQQARVAGLASLATLFLVLLLGFTLYQMTTALPENAAVQYGIGLMLPLAALLLIWLAVRAIRKDEALVKSMDRLR